MESIKIKLSTIAFQNVTRIKKHINSVYKTMRKANLYHDLSNDVSFDRLPPCVVLNLQFYLILFYKNSCTIISL